MTKQKYTVLYPDNLSNAVFPSRAAARRYLVAEADVYAGFLLMLGEQADLKSIPGFRGSAVSSAQLSTSLDRLIDALEDPESFARVQLPSSGSAIAIPPPSNSLEGQLILGLTNNQRVGEAISVYVWFAAKQKVIAPRKDANAGTKAEYGQKLVTAALASEALPFRAETSQRLAGAMRRAENQSLALQEEVEAAQRVNGEHENELAVCREKISTRAKRIERIFLRRERRHRSQFFGSTFGV